MIPYGRQCLDQADKDALLSVLESDWLTQGPLVPAFEQALAKHCQVDYAVATNSGTSALHIACLALKLGPGDWLWTSPISFVASANCGRYCGAEIDFVDIDLSTGLLSVAALKAKLINAQQRGCLPKVLVVVHFAGQSCAMQEIQQLSQDYGFYIIEDACHALGGSYQAKPIGHCQYSDISVFSFHPVKSITSAEGGMLVTQDEDLAQRARMLVTHGITRESGRMTAPTGLPWYYEQQLLGFNYRLSDVHAALGLSQLKKLDSFCCARRAIAQRYDEAFTDASAKTSGEILPQGLKPSDASRSAHHLYVLRFPGIDMALRDEYFMRLRALGIGVNLHYMPIYRQPYYQAFNYDPNGFPQAEAFFASVISLPIFPDLTQADQAWVIQSVKGLMENAARDNVSQARVS